MSAPNSGIHRLPIDIPWPTGPVNVYLVEDDPLTLVDTGPNLTTALAGLEASLAESGRRIEDLERVIVTHHHVDHMGLASVIKERAGAEVCAIDKLAPLLERWTEHDALIEQYAEELMRAHGVPGAAIAANRVPDPRRIGWDPSVSVDRVLRDGDTLEFAHRRWRVLLRPGHSPFDTLFFDERTGDLLVGDHLLAKISPNPVITPPDLGPIEERPRALVTYRVSLRATREIPANVVLTGHGAPISDLRGHIDMRLAEMDRRTARIRDLIARGASTGHDVALQIWGDSAVSQPWLTISEVLGHVDRLAAEGEVIEESDGDAVRLVLARP